MQHTRTTIDYDFSKIPVGYKDINKISLRCQNDINTILILIAMQYQYDISTMSIRYQYDINQYDINQYDINQYNINAKKI